MKTAIFGISLAALAAVRTLSAVGGSVPADGFTAELLVDLDNVTTDETFYRCGALTVSLRTAGKVEYDWNYGNYMNFPMPRSPAAARSSPGRAAVSGRREGSET